MANDSRTHTPTPAEAVQAAICELSNPDASFNERIEIADYVRRAFGMPTSHTPDCACNDPDFDDRDGDGNDCTCGFWDKPKIDTSHDGLVEALRTIATMPLYEQDDMTSANMRIVARRALEAAGIKTTEV